MAVGGDGKELEGLKNERVRKIVTWNSWEGMRVCPRFSGEGDN